jgi:MFS family permease
LLPTDGSVERRVLTISASAFIIMLGAGVVVPILPKYAETFGASYTYVGFFISAFGLARILTDIPFGTLSDRRASLLGGTILFVASGLLAAFTTGIEYLIAARVVQGAAIHTTSALAYVADIIPATRKGRYLGYYQNSFFLGSAFGPSTGGVLTSLDSLF